MHTVSKNLLRASKEKSGVEKIVQQVGETFSFENKFIHKF